MGRPQISIDIKQLESFMRLSPNLEDTANFFNCHANTIENVIKKEFRLTFCEFRDKNAVHTRMGIKRKMIEKAMSGDNTMLIWLSKNMLGMSDKLEQSANVSHSFSNKTDEELDLRLKELLSSRK